MKILYLTTLEADYLSDNILYGLRKNGHDVLDYPKKEIMYKSCETPNNEIYGNGFTLYKTLDEIKRPETDTLQDMLNNEFDIVIFSDIWRLQAVFAHFTVFKWFDIRSKFIFLDGTDDGFPTTSDCFKRGLYFKRDNPFNYPEIKIIGLSIPETKLLKKRPVKSRLFSTHVQCSEAFRMSWINANCTRNPVFNNEKDYYKDLANSKYGVTMKKSGWDTPRHMENAANWVVNCIWETGWDWDPVDFHHRDQRTHPLGFKDMENCIIWKNAEDLEEKINEIEKKGLYEKISQASRKWVETKTCEKMAEYVMSYV